MNKKQRYKVISLFGAIALFVSCALTPIVAHAAATVGVVGVRAVSASATNEDYKDLGQLKIEAPIADLKEQDFFLLRLPTDFKINIPAATDATTDIAGATIALPDGTTAPLLQMDRESDPWNDGATEHLAVFWVEPNELKVVVKNPTKSPNGGTDANTIFKINLGSVYIPGDAKEVIEAIIESEPGSAFANERVTLAKKGTGTVEIAIDSVQTIPRSGDGVLNTIRFKEDSPGALKSGSQIKLTLPNGYEWKDSGYPIQFMYGDRETVEKFTVERGSDRRDLIIRVPATTNAASYFTLKNASIAVVDETLVTFGDIALDVSGPNKTNVESLIVGKYVDYITTANVIESKDVIAGRAGVSDPKNSEIGRLKIEEHAQGSLRAGGTIRIRLDGGVKWAVDGENNLIQAPQLNLLLSDLQGLEFDHTVGNQGWQLVDDETIMISIKTASNGTKGSKLVWGSGLIDIAADAQATDVRAWISGSAGVSGNAGVIARVIQPIGMSALDATLKPIQGGARDRETSDFIVKEQVAGAIDAEGEDPFIRFTFPSGVMPNQPTPDQIKVDGDLALDTTRLLVEKDGHGKWYLQIPVKAASTAPSTITFISPKVTVDRTVPEGELRVEMSGSLIQTAGNPSSSFPQSDTIGSVAVANVIVPANGTIMNSVVFNIGSTTYTVNDEEKELDVAPFIDKNGRTLMPVRAVAEAFDAVVGWDPEDRRVSILKGGKALSITVGGYVMNVNGVFVQIDSPAINKEGRVFLPLRVIAEAFGAKINWDAQTKTIYLN